MHEDILAQCDNLNTLGIITSPHNIVKLCLAFLILLANTILISVILKSQKFRNQRFHMFIISLALADILVGLIIPFMVITAKENTWGLGVHFCQGVTSLQKVSLAVSTYSFLGINVDRLLAMKMPWAYREWEANSTLTKRPILLCWVLGVLPAIPMWLDPEGLYQRDLLTCSCHFPHGYTFWVWWSGITAFFLPGSILLVVSTVIICHMAAYITDKTRSSTTQTNYLKERKITKIMIAITSVFFFCVAPYFLFFLYPGNQDFKEAYLPYIVMVMYLNSLINPLLYMVINSDIREAIYGGFSCKKKPVNPGSQPQVYMSNMSLGKIAGSQVTISSSL